MSPGLFAGPHSWLPVKDTHASVQQEITGTVTDGSNGEALPGVSILIKGTTLGTVTDMDGRYRIAVPGSDAVLVFSFLGFESQEISVGPNSEINVRLQPDVRTLSEVVVVGYGTVEKSDLTGSVASVKMEAIKDIPANSVERLLQGRSAGLQVISSSQDPGAGATVRIRGGSSLQGSNAPLVVVDGFPLGDAGNLHQINPNDIESVEVLKDASASAIYGSRGANAVIMITTKKAKAGQTRISLQQESTYSEFTS